MILGILSDTHDHLPLVRTAVRFMNAEGVDLVLHAGDFVSPFVIPELANLSMPVVGVFGNNDGDRALLLAKCAAAGNVEIRGYFAEIDADGFSVALSHGHETALLGALVRSNAFDAVVHGHTHEAGSYTAGETLVVNPGEACGYLTGHATAALLDTVARTARIVHL
ncbi:MAG: metallophosphoesterase [Methanomicrobiaceae archaeon]|nr:metallophosphoesterase [Methanomicrobiaceae archaeon]